MSLENSGFVNGREIDEMLSFGEIRGDRPQGGLHFCRDFVVIWQDICREVGGRPCRVTSGVDFKMMTFSRSSARHGVGGGASRRMPIGAPMSGFEKPPRGRRLCPRRRAVDRAAAGNVKLWKCGTVKVWKYENGLGLRQIPPRGARGRAGACNGRDARCPSCARSTLLHGYSTHLSTIPLFHSQRNGRDARCPSRSERVADVGF